MPALVLSLEAMTRGSVGLGARAALVRGALSWRAKIDLASPVLSEEPTFTLLDDTRTILTLPHGSLVQADGTAGPLAAADLTVKVENLSRVVVAGTPTGTQVTADPLVGRLTFGTALPPTGTVDVTYFVSQWERRVERLRGTLRIDACAAVGDDAALLATATINALVPPDGLPPTVIPGVLSLGLVSLSSVGAKEPGSFDLRRRTMRLTFEFENVIDRPDSSGGIIQRIPIEIRMADGDGDLGNAVTVDA
jgi:hypothetical protein